MKRSEIKYNQNGRKKVTRNIIIAADEICSL
ncbi:hypothetical protein AT2G03823, partial [Arabidopsis thaliana]